jgi:hypothetical protein
VHVLVVPAQHTSFLVCFYFCFVVLGMKSRASCMLGKWSFLHTGKCT